MFMPSGITYPPRRCITFELLLRSTTTVPDSGTFQEKKQNTKVATLHTYFAARLLIDA